MSVGDRFRRAVASVGQALGGRRPSVELVRVDQPEPSPPPRPALPLPALPPPQWPLCPVCGQRHAPPRPRPGGLAAYGWPVLPDPGRPAPLGRTADETPLVRDRFRPWREP